MEDRRAPAARKNEIMADSPERQILTDYCALRPSAERPESYVAVRARRAHIQFSSAAPTVNAQDHETW